MTDPRVCCYQPCGKPLTRKPKEKPSQYAGRRFCNQQCAARHASGSTITETPHERVCVCGNMMRRRPNEQPGRFANRKHCSHACSAAHADRKPREPKPQTARETKTCTVCGQPAQRRRGEGPLKWQKRETCSISCAAKQRRTRETATGTVAIPVDGRVCLYPPCGKPLEPARRETPKKFADRKHCNKSCATAHQNAGRRPTNDNDLPDTKTCEGCGATLQRGNIGPSQWRARRYCSIGCASRHRPPTQPRPTGAAAPVILEAPTSRPRTIWRPAGLSKIPNAWAGHRPPEPDPPDDDEAGGGPP